MRKNEAGLTILETGDVVRIGGGKVLYTVEYDETVGMLHVTSHNTGKSVAVERERLHLVESVQDVAYEAGCSVEEVKSVVTGEPVAAFTPIETVSHTTEVPVKEDASYQKAVLLALNLKGKHVYAGTVSETKKAKTRSLNRRQKASRKANR